MWLETRKGVNRRSYNFELDREFHSSSIMNVLRMHRLSYAGHMIGRLEDLSQRAIFRTERGGKQD
jgi:hypothetical protein